MAEIIKPIILDETGKEIVDAIKNISITVEGKNGLPQGGLANQILSKKSDTDYDAEWVDNIGQVESVNGKTGQVTLTAEDVGATTEQWVNQQNYLKSIPSEYITETELNAKGYLTEHQDISNLATKAEVPTKTSQLINDSNFLTEHQDISNLATKEEVSEVENKIPTKVSQLENDKGYLTEHQDLTGYAKKTDIPDVSGFITEIPAEYVTDDELNAKGYLTEHQSLANYYTKPEVNELIPDLSGYALKTEIPTVPTNVSAFNNDVGYLTEIPAEYVTETELNSKGYLTEHQSLANYSTTEEMNNAISNHHDNTKQDKLTAGSNITIENNVISATGGGSGSSYTFTDGLTETDGTVKWDLSDKIKKDTHFNLIIPMNPDGYTPRATGTNGLNVGVNVNKYGARGTFPILFGQDNETSTNSMWAYCFGSANINDGRASFCIGVDNELHTNKTNNIGSVIIGYRNTASIANGGYGNDKYCLGSNLEISSDKQVVLGMYNIEDSSSLYRFIVGTGDYDSRVNGFTLDASGNGTFAGTVSSSTGADYAEYFEWKDGNTENEDRVGYIVTLDGDKIVKANSGDDILGICSGTAMVLGDSAEWNWAKRFLTDDFGRIIYEDIDVEHEAVLDEEGNVIEEAYVEHIHKPKENPNYDSSKPYERRSDRPEWQIVGMMGKLYVRDNGTCEVNGYATVDNGVAIKSTEKTNMRVMERVTENIVRVLLK